MGNGKTRLMLKALKQGNAVITSWGLMEVVLALTFSCISYHAISYEASASNLRKWHCERTN